MASSATKLVCMFLVLSLAGQSMATEYLVGGELGWGISLDLNAWLLGKTFHVGDVLVFKYPINLHSVTVVDLNSYNLCKAEVTLSTDLSGLTKIPLNKPGPLYIISTVGLDCLLGLKLKIDVQL